MPGTSKNAARVIDQDEEDYREIITRKLIPDLINFDNVMPNSTMNTVFMSRGSMTRIGTAELSASRKIASQIVDGFMGLATRWFCWRLDDNPVSYLVRVTLGVTMAMYVFYILYNKHLNRYLSQVKYSLPYILELDQ